MFLGFIFTAGTWISLTFASGAFGASELANVNSLAAFKAANILGLWTVQVPNIDLITTGIAALVKMDFAFFVGGMGMIKFLLIMTIGAATVWGIFTVIIYVISGLFPK